MVTDILFWIVLTFIITMLVIWWCMYEVLKNKVHNNYKSLCEIEKMLDSFGKNLNWISDDVVNSFTQRDIKLSQSIDMLRKNVNDLRASFEANCGKNIKVDEELYGNKGKVKTFAEMSIEDINIYNELNQKNDVKEDSDNDFSVEEL